MELVLISVVGMVLFGGLFLLLCPEWWSTSLGTLKEKKPAAKDPSDTQAGKSAAFQHASRSHPPTHRNHAAE